MRRDRINNLIKTVYGERYGLSYPQRATRFQYPLTRGVQSALAQTQHLVYGLRKKWVAITFASVLLLLVAASAYYYNLLMREWLDMLAALSNESVLMQRRNDLSLNLSKAVQDYSEHEKKVYSAVVAMRSLAAKGQIEEKELKEIIEELQQERIISQAEEPQKALAKADENSPHANPLSSLSNLMAIAEQYPDLKLSANFQSLMTALIDVEKDLAAERMKFNDKANIYGTHVRLFPNKLFARIFGFRCEPYFNATEDAKKFKPIDY